MLHEIELNQLRLPRDRMVERAWRVCLSVLIFAVASCAVALGYAAFFALIDAQWSEAGTYGGIACVLGAGTAWLCYNRNDLVGSV